MSIESESDEKGEDFGSDDSERCVGLEDGHIENGERWEMTSMKSQSSPQAGHRTEGGSSDDFDQGQLREPANLVGDPRRGSVQGWLEADSVKRRVDTDQAGGIPFADESRWKKPSTVSRKRPRRAAAPAQEQGRIFLHTSYSVARNIRVEKDSLMHTPSRNGCGVFENWEAD